MNFLDFQAKKGTGFLHPGGALLTEALINELSPVVGMRVLEIGCGTGATVVRLTKHYRLKSTAVDISENMLSSAKQRARFNNVTDEIDFVRINTNGILPFTDNSFDAVYAESVLAIMDENVLPQMLKEISRVLVSKGKFISNDAIWKDDASSEDIKRVNDKCLKDFGIVQSIARPAYLAQWQAAFEFAGLAVVKTIDRESIAPSSSVEEKDLFSFYKTFTALLDPDFFIKRLRYNKALRGRHRNDGDFLESYLFVTENSK